MKHHDFNIFYVSSSVKINGKYETTPLHRLITNCERNKIVDHIDHNPLNNRRNNLRVCTIAENGMNRKPNYNSVSGCTGVGFDNSRKKWTAHIKVKALNKNLHKYCNTKEEAIEQRRQWELEFWGKETLEINDENRKRTGES